MEHGSPHVVESLFDAARGSVEVHGVHGEDHTRSNGLEVRRGVRLCGG